ncbi:MAG: cell division protein FtsZ [Elusimicrobiota bacterium]
MRIKIAEDFNEQPAVIKVIGVGGGGGNAVNRMVRSEFKTIEFITANTDAQSLRHSLAGVKLQIGTKLTKGLGVGGDPVKGRQAAEESREALTEALSGADMIFVTAGMGGGTGTGAAPVIGEIARSQGALTIAVVTKPFMFEGKLRNNQAEEGIKELRKCVDTLVIIPNQKLFSIIDEKTPAIKAFEVVDDVLRQAVGSISNVITLHGFINRDLVDVKTIMQNAGDALIGMGEGRGQDRAMQAVRAAISSPLLEDVTLDGAKGVLVNIIGTKEITMHEINQAMSLIHQTVASDARVFFGQAFDETLGDKIQITVIATGFPSVKKTTAKNTNSPDRFLQAEIEISDLDKPAYLRIKTRKIK